MASSILNPRYAPQQVTVLDCQAQICQTSAAAFGRLVNNLAGNVFPTRDNTLALPIASYELVNIPSLIVVGLPLNKVTYNSFNGLRVTAEDLLTMNSRYGLANPGATVAIDQTTTTIASAAAAYTSTGVSVNTDHVATWALTTGRLRLFGRLVRVTVASDISRIQFSMTGTASPYPELCTVEIAEDDCREITLFVPARTTTRFVAHSGSPVDQLTLMYNLPFEISSQEAVASGSSLYVTFRVFNYSGTQVVSNATVDVWAVPYTPALMEALSPNRGLLTNGASWIPSTPIWVIPNMQNIV